MQELGNMKALMVELELWEFQEVVEEINMKDKEKGKEKEKGIDIKININTEDIE